MVLILVFTGLICSWAAWIVLALSIGPSQEDDFLEPRSKPFLYYALHGGGMLAVIGAGIIAGLKGGFKRLGGAERTMVVMLIVTSLLWAAVTYSVNDYLSWKAFEPTGPMIWLTCVLIFAGMDRSVWKLLNPTIRIIAYITAGIALSAMISANFSTSRWYSSHVRYMVLLMWFGGYTFLTIGECSGWRVLLRCFPYLVFILSCIVTRTRSYSVMSVALLIALFFVSKRAELNWTQERTKKLVVILYTLVMVFLLTLLIYREPVVGAFNRLVERMNVDTRTGQYVDFFSQVPLSDLILGRGPTGTYDWGGRKNYKYFDNSYIWLAFIGGLPILVSYIVLIILPGATAYLRGARGNEAVAAALIILWCLSCAGLSTYARPSLSPYNYLVVLMAGRCLNFLSEARQIKIWKRLIISNQTEQSRNQINSV